MPVSTDRTATARVRTYAIFVKRERVAPSGRRETIYVRRPYNIVEYDWNDGNPVKTYLQPAGRGGRKESATGQAAGATNTDFGSAYFAEVYDDIRVYDTPPAFDSIYGGAQYLVLNNEAVLGGTHRS